MADRTPWYDAFYYDDPRGYYQRLVEEDRASQDSDRRFRGVDYRREGTITTRGYRRSPGWLGAAGVSMPSYGPWGAYDGRETYAGYRAGTDTRDYGEPRERTVARLRSWVQEGPHTGRGPGRSDARIRDEACSRLTRHGRLDATGIDIAVEGGEVTLSGAVNSRREKRMAEDALESIRGVRDVHNRLRIRR